MSETAPTGGPEAAGSDEAESDEAYCAACDRSYATADNVCPRDGTRLVWLRSQRDALLGRVIDDRYEIRASLGRGGMGTVYTAWQRSVDREVAIKVVDGRVARSRLAAKRFLREARLASRLSQPSIVNVHDFGQTDDGVLYLVMELLRGRTLAKLIATAAPMTPRRALAIGVQLCDALDAAHGHGIVHRDLKPQNVVVLDDPPGRDLLKVLDFGLAKSLVGDGSTVTESNTILGTPLYMAPEMVQRLDADQRSDLYALGCILYELLSGRPPFEGDLRHLLTLHLTATPSPLPTTVPAPLRGLIESLLAKSPEQRPPSAAAVRARLLATLQLDGMDVPAKIPVRRAQVAETLDAGSDSVEGTVTGTDPSQAGLVIAARDGGAREPMPRWMPSLALVALAALVAVVTWRIARDGDDARPVRAPEPPASVVTKPAAAMAPADVAPIEPAPVPTTPSPAAPTPAPVVTPPAPAAATPSPAATTPASASSRPGRRPGSRRPTPTPTAPAAAAKASSEQTPAVTPAPTPTAPSPTPAATAPTADPAIDFILPGSDRR